MNTKEFAQLIELACQKGVLKKLIFSRPTGDAPQKISGRLCLNRGKKLLALEKSLRGDTVSQENIPVSEITERVEGYINQYKQVNLLTTASDVEYKLSKDGSAVFLGADKLMRKLSGNTENFEAGFEALDRKKNYILSGDEEFLKLLGISDKSGRIHDKKQGKYRQINRFLEYLSEVYPKLPDTGELTVYDLCCGKSYLSFAVYYYLTAIRKREVRMLCIDLKADVIEFCKNLAMELSFGGMTFMVDNVENTPSDICPDMVISLHACDVATDIVLDTAVRLGAKVILSTPCCHRNLSAKINSPYLEFVTKYPKLKGKLCDALTDALRLERLAAFGYEASATELVDPEDTPKNILLRAIKISEFSPEAYDGYLGLLKSLMGDGFKNYLKKP